MHALLSRPVSKRLKSCAIAAPLLIATAFLDAGRANAVVVNVNGADYDVNYFDGTYDDNSSRFNPTDMPWWNDPGLAQSFALAVDGSLGVVYGGTYGPLFAFKTETGPLGSSVLSYVKDPGWPNVSYTGNGFSELRPYAFVQQPQPVPGPLPVLGAAAAFGWSRRMRRRLKCGANAR